MMVRTRQTGKFAGSRRAWLLLGIVLTLLLPALAVVPAHAERSTTTPSGWWWLHNVSLSQVEDKIDDGYRIFDLEIEQTSPLRFNTVMIKNEGVHQKGWWWYYGVSSEFISNKLNEDNARVLDLETYWVNGEQRFAAVLVPNTGDEAKTWWWYVNITAADVTTYINRNQARLIDLETYVVNGQRRYSVVMIKNQGNDAMSWWWYINVSPSYISDRLNENQARLVDIERHADGTFTVIMNKSQGEYWWWYHGLTSTTQINNLTAQNGARLIDVETYQDDGSKRFAVLMLNNSNAITTRVGNLLRTGTDGTVGLYLKQVNGPVLAALQHNYAFEPASTIKVVPHLYAMREVQNNANVSLNYQLPHFTDAPKSCPSTAQSGTESLETALEEMMGNSDNARTRAVIDEFGRSNINTMAQDVVNMSSTSINHTIGCGEEMIINHNQLTLADVGRLYEGVATASLLNPTNRETFFSLMGGQNWGRVMNMVDEEAPASLTSTEIQNFKDQIRTAWKGGSYGWNGVHWRSLAGWAQIPFCSNSGVLVPRQYVFGVFIDEATNEAAANSTLGNTAAEPLREQIRAGLQSWDACSDQSLIRAGLSNQFVEDTRTGVIFRPSSQLIPPDGLVIELQEVPQPPIPDPGPLHIFVESMLEIHLFDAGSGDELERLAGLYEIELSYTDQQLAEAGINNEETLMLYAYNGSQWEPVEDTQVDTASNQLLASLDETGLLALGGTIEDDTEPPQPDNYIYLPLIKR